MHNSQQQSYTSADLVKLVIKWNYEAKYGWGYLEM